MVGETAALQGLEQAGVSETALADITTRLLDAAPGFVKVSKAAAGTPRFLGQVTIHRAEVRAGGDGDPATAYVVLTVSLESTSGEATLREVGRGSATVGSGKGGLRSGLELAARSALQTAVSSFAAQLAAERKTSAELIRDLAAPEAGVRDHATRVLATRGDRAAVPALIARLEDPDVSVRERAVGALAQLRDARAVKPLIALVHRRDPEYVAQMARIVGDIGGPDATAWLLTMAWGHPDATVRTAAHEALADMSARDVHAHAQR